MHAGLRLVPDLVRAHVVEEGVGAGGAADLGHPGRGQPRRQRADRTQTQRVHHARLGLHDRH